MKGVSEMVLTFDVWISKLAPTSSKDRYFVANDELITCFFNHNRKWGNELSRQELLQVLRGRHPAGVHPISTIGWRRVGCPEESFNNGR